MKPFFVITMLALTSGNAHALLWHEKNADIVCETIDEKHSPGLVWLFNDVDPADSKPTLPTTKLSFEDFFSGLSIATINTDRKPPTQGVGLIVLRKEDLKPSFFTPPQKLQPARPQAAGSLPGEEYWVAPQEGQEPLMISDGRRSATAIGVGKSPDFFS